MLGLGVQQCWIRLNMPLFIETEGNSVFCGPERHQRSNGHKTWRWQLRGHKTQCRWIYAGLKWKLLLVEFYWFSPVMYREFFKNSKSAPNHSKLSENCGKPFLSSKQLVLTDKNVFYQMLVKFWYPRLIGVKKQTCGSSSRPSLFFSADPIINAIRGGWVTIPACIASHYYSQLRFSTNV
jgi:hypothetical protein